MDIRPSFDESCSRPRFNIAKSHPISTGSKVVEGDAADGAGMERRVNDARRTWLERCGKSGFGRLSSLAHKFGDVFTQAAGASICSCTWIFERSSFRSVRVNFHSKGWAAAQE